MPFHGLRYVLPALVLSTALQAQTQPARTTQYWITAGAGVVSLWDDRAWLGQGGQTYALAASLQRGVLVGSVRGIRATADHSSGWGAGLLLGAGSPARYDVHGTVGAGLGISSDSRGRTGVTLPLELQLGWRLSHSFGLGTYFFANLGGPSQSFGAAASIQIGKLR